MLSSLEPSDDRPIQDGGNYNLNSWLEIGGALQALLAFN
jgi:hypothetical protein